MTGEQIATLFERLARLVGATKQKAGDGSAWDYTFPDGETHRYVIRGLKSHAEAEDSAFNLIIWIWSAKDYLKQRAQALGRPAQIVEDAVNVAPVLTVCADLANRLKHGDLKVSRSGRQAGTRGSHRQYKHPSKSGTVTVAGKPSVDVPPGTLNAILKQAGLRKEK